MNTPPPEPPGYPSPQPPPSPNVCPNCRQPYERDPQFCPHCGYNLQPIPQPKFVAGSNGLDIFLALVVCVLCVPLAVTAVIPLILYIVMDKRYVGFRKGLGIGLILYAVIILGALAFCGYVIFALSHEHR